MLVARRASADDVVNADMREEVGAWAEGGVADVALLRAVERCIEARESLTHNANVPLAIESALLAVGRLVPPPQGAARAASAAES